MMTTQWLESEDGLMLHLKSWKTKEMPKAIVILSHGMAEHIERYSHFASSLNREGYWVYGHDHRGHGQSVNEHIVHGVLAQKNGWEKLVSDLYHVVRWVKSENPKTPIILFGHSMGSFAVRALLRKQPQEIAGVILCGTGDQNLANLFLGKKLAQLEALILGKSHPSTWLTALSFGNYNRSFKPIRTTFDWLSTNASAVDAYMSDPLCGIVFSAGFYVDFLEGLYLIQREEKKGNLPLDIKYLLISGQDDPLAEDGKAINRIYHRYRQAGIQHIEKHLFSNMRHELINEINVTKVEKLLFSWMAHL